MATAAQSEDGPPAPRSPVASQRSLSAGALLAGGPPPAPDDAKHGGLAAVVCASDYGNPPPPNSTHRSSRTSVERPGPAKVDGAAANDGGFQERKSSFSSARQDYDHPERQQHYCRQHGCCSPNAEPDVLSLEQGNFVSSVPEIAMPEFPRSHNTPQEIVAILEGLGHKKCSTKILKTFLLSVMAGFWITLAGILATSLAGGFPVDVRVRWPVLPRLLTAAVFPVGLIFEVLFGGELFTGNTMILFVSWLSGRITKRALAVNWSTVWLGNLAGSLLTLVLFAWLPGLFENEPFRAFAIAGAEVRGSLSYEIVFLRSVPANVLVCLSIYLGLMARDVVGKAFGMYVPIFVFVATTMEHCIADMYFVPMGMLLGANVGFDSCVVFLIVCTVGNVVGGSLLVGGSLWYMHGADMTRSAVRKKFDEK